MQVVNKCSINHKHTTSNNLDDRILRDPLLQFSALTNTETAVVNHLFKLSAKYPDVFVSQANLASWLGITRRQVNRVISKLASLGIITKIYREYNTSLYRIPDFFKQDSIKKLLKKIIPNIVDLAFSIQQLLSSTITSIFRENTMQKKEYDDDTLFGELAKEEAQKRTYSAPYHRPWKGNTTPSSQLFSGFKHISSVFSGFSKNTKESPNKKVSKEIINIPKVDEDTLLAKLNKLSQELPADTFNRLMENGRTLEERVKITERYLTGLKLKQGANI